MEYKKGGGREEDDNEAVEDDAVRDDDDDDAVVELLILDFALLAVGGELLLVMIAADSVDDSVFCLTISLLSRDISSVSLLGLVVVWFLSSCFSSEFIPFCCTCSSSALAFSETLRSDIP